jgi:hypothetical protein
LLALVASAVFVNRQLRSDIKLRRAERTTRITDPLAEEVISVALTLDRLPPEEFMKSVDWPDYQRMSDLRHQTQLQLPTGLRLDGLYYELEAVSRAWRVCRELAEETSRKEPRVRGKVFAVAILHTRALYLRFAGGDLKRWDGLPPMPGRRALGDEMERDLLKEEKEWRSQFSEMLETERAALRDHDD